MKIPTINIGTIPDECFAYTQIFNAFRVEMAVCIFIGMMIGIATAWLYENK